MRKRLWNDLSVFCDRALPPSALPLPPSSVCLDGEWDFFLARNEYCVPAGFEREEFDDSAFFKLPVPSNWQFHTSDIPIYSNLTYPYPLRYGALRRLPNIDAENNPVGCYRLRFKAPSGERTVLRFDGVCSAGAVYINGEYVGYTQNSFGRFEFEITDYIREGENLLAVLVPRYSDGSYFENQDMWRVSGIFRSVYLYTTPRAHIADLFVKTSLDGCVSLDVSLKAVRGSGVFAASLYDAAGSLACEKSVDVIADKDAAIHLTLGVASPRLWSYETPYLYRLVVTLDAGGRDARELPVGVREIGIAGDEPRLTLNGRAIKLRGVNRHEFDPENGFAVSVEFNKRDLEIIKKNNFNAIRTSHYPPSEGLMNLCDSMGLLVVCENNLETHTGGVRIPRSKPRWARQCLFRMDSMINTYKNHPSVYMWSLGNESGSGRVFLDMYALSKRIDDTRPVHYECMPAASDVISGMYQLPPVMEAVAKHRTVVIGRNTYNAAGNRLTYNDYKDKPFMQCEYSHCMGNSLGNIADYWDLFNKYDRLCGGFVWDYADLGIYKNNRYNYGGDFGDKPNDTNFCFNGLVRADREYNPAMHALRSAQSPFVFECDGETITLVNTDPFTAVSGSIELTQYSGGRLVDSRVIDGVSLSGGERKSYIVEKRGEILSAVLIAGGERCRGSFELSPFVPRAQSDARAECSVSGNILTMTYKGTAALINIDNARIEQVLCGGAPMLEAPVRVSFTRAPIDNERYLLVPKVLRFLFDTSSSRRAAESLRVVSVTADGAVELVCRAKGVKRLVVRYSFTSEGALRLTSELVPKKSFQKSGFTFALPLSYDSVKYSGYGPYENYPDRTVGSSFGEYETTPADFCHRYLKPQDNGNRTGVTDLTISGGGEVSISCIKAPLNLSVYPYSTEQLCNTAHDAELSPDRITVNIDGAVRGAGGDAPGWLCVKDEFNIVKNKTYLTDAAVGFAAKKEER